MRFNREKDNHELFIRTTTAVRPNAPLKLNANVVGKFNVEHLLDKVSKQLQESTAAAAKQKTERKTIMLSTPPVTTTTKSSAAKRKTQTKTTIAPTKVITVTKNFSTQPTVPAASSSSTLPEDTVQQLRQRLVHYLALGSGTAADVLKNVGGVEAEWDVKRKISELLNEVSTRVHHWKALD